MAIMLDQDRHTGLPSRPWWDPGAFPIVAKLEANFAAIRAEYVNLLMCGQLRLHPQSSGGPRKTISDGNWSLFDLISNGRVNADNARLVPRTMDALQALGGTQGHRGGLAYFSVLEPRVRIAPHRGPTNARIRIHLGLRVPPGASMRVGDETRTWAEGRCVVFDDSFEHAVFNDSAELRAVLLVDVWHPDLTARQKAERAMQRQPVEPDDDRRRDERKGWLDKSRLAGTGRPLRSLVGTEHLLRMTASISKAAGLGGGIFSMLNAFALQAADATDIEQGRRPGHKTPTGRHDFWSDLAKLIIKHPAQFSTADLVDVIHIGCVRWYSTALSNEHPALVPSDGLPRAVGILRWCNDQSTRGVPFSAIAVVAVVALQTGAIGAGHLPLAERSG